METKKIIGVIFSIIFICAFGFCLIWTITNWDTVTTSMDGTKLYTSEDIQSAYKDGYDTALTDKDSYDELIESYRNSISSLQDNITTLNTQITTLQGEKGSKEREIESLTVQLQSKSQELTNTVQSYETQLNTLTLNYTSQIETLNNTITSLQSSVSTLTSQNTSLQGQVSTKQGIIDELNNTITTLQNEKTYLERQVELLQDELENCFNYDYSIIVNFNVDNELYSTCYARNEGYVLLPPVNPTKQGYEFDGWAIDGEIVDLLSYAITEETTFEAMFTAVYEVNFVVDNVTISTQSIRNNNIATLPTEPTKLNYDFVGWSLNENGATINVSAYSITSNTTFYAVFSANVEFITFTVEGTTYTAEKDMTFGEWVESDYNIDDEWTIYDFGGMGYVVYSNDTMTGISGYYSDDVIENNKAYTLQGFAYCFVAGTQITTTLDGQTANIEDLGVGDTIVSLNVFTNERYLAKIKQVFVTENVSNIVRLTLENGTVVEMTEGHPLLCRDAFKTILDDEETHKLKVGDEVYTESGYSEIISIEYLDITTTVYNFDVIDFNEAVIDNDTYDNYFANGICAHNVHTTPYLDDSIYGDGSYPPPPIDPPIEPPQPYQWQSIR